MLVACSCTFKFFRHCCVLTSTDKHGSAHEKDKNRELPKHPRLLGIFISIFALWTTGDLHIIPHIILYYFYKFAPKIYAWKSTYENCITYFSLRTFGSTQGIKLFPYFKHPSGNDQYL